MLSIYLNNVCIYFVADVLLPSDSLLTKHNEIDVANMSLSQCMSSASYPADSTITENLQNKSHIPLFKKPFNVKYKQNPRYSLFDSDMKDSEPDTPEQNVHRPFLRRRRRGYSKTDVSFSKNSNVSNENIDLSNCSFNLSNLRKNKNLENSLGKDIDSESDDSFSTGPVFQRQKASHAKRIQEVFHDVLEHSSDSSLSKISPLCYKTHVQIESQGRQDDFRKSHNPTAEPQYILPQNMNLITRRRARQKKLIKNNIFDEDVLTSESDESFTLKPALKRHTLVEGVKKSSIFDDDLELSINPNVSIAKSPTLRKLPFLISKKTCAENLSGFDSSLNESLNISENEKSKSHDIFPKKFVKDSINFDDVVNNTCDGSSLSNSLTLRDKSFEKEEKSLHGHKSCAIDSSELMLNNQTGHNISEKTKELDISYTRELSNFSEIDNECHMVVSLGNVSHEISNEPVVQESYKNIEENSRESSLESTIELPVNETTMESNDVPITVYEDQEKCVQLRYNKKDLSSESKNTPTKLNEMEEDSNGLENYTEADPSRSHSVEYSKTQFTSTGQYYQTEISTESEIKRTIQINDLVKDNHEDDISRVIDYNSKDLISPVNVDTSKNKSILKQNEMTINLSKTDENSGRNDFILKASLTKDQSEESISKIHNFSGNPGKSFESSHCKYNKDSDQLSKTDDINSKSLTSLREIKKPNVKRVSFKLRNDGKEGTTGRNSMLNNTYREDKSNSRFYQSLILNNSCSLENLVFDGSSPEITSDSVYIDLCASRNKSSSVNNMNIEGNGYQDDNADKQGVQLQCEESRKSEKGDTEIDEDSLEDSDDGKETDKDGTEDSDDGLEAGLKEDGRENLEIEELNDEGEKIIKCSEENVDTELQRVKHKEHHKESTKDKSVHIDEISTINESSLSERLEGDIVNPSQHCVTDEFFEGNDNSFFCSANNRLDKPNSLPTNTYNCQFKKPGSCTVLNEKYATPPTKRKVQEILAKIPLSEFKNKKAKPVSAIQTKEQIEQDKIEEVLRKRQKQITVRTTKTSKLTKPKYMYPKVYDFIIEKLTPSFGLKSRVQAESLVVLLNEQADVIMKNEKKLAQTVQDMKIKLANLKIIHTHWDFYKFIMNYFHGPFTQKMYPSGVVSPFEPDDPFQTVCS